MSLFFQIKVLWYCPELMVHVHNDELSHFHSTYHRHDEKGPKLRTKPREENVLYNQGRSNHPSNIILIR